MQTNIPVEEILKVDRRGRVWVPADRRRALLEEFDRCGVSARQFAAAVGIKYQTFAGWVKRRKDREAGGAAQVAVSPSVIKSEVRWMEAVVGEDGDFAGKQSVGRGLMVALPGGARMEVANAAHAVLAAELLRALETKVRSIC